MSWIDDRLRDLGNNEAVAETYDSLVGKLPLSDSTKSKVIDGGHAAGSMMVTGLRKAVQVAESAVQAGVKSAKEPLAEDPIVAGTGPASESPNAEFLADLERLAKLRAEGAITHEEFEIAKSRLLRGEG